jgi:hypothetical protein
VEEEEEEEEEAAAMKINVSIIRGIDCNRNNCKFLLGFALII